MNIQSLMIANQMLAKEVLNVLPLIEKHFKPYNGQRVATQTGKAAKFKKVCDSFLSDCEQFGAFQITVQLSRYSVFVKVVTTYPTSPSGIRYFEVNVYFGDIKDNCLVYEFNPMEYETSYKRILETSLSDINHAKETYNKLENELEQTKKSIPYCFHEIFK